MKKLIVLGLLGVIGWMPFKASAQISVSLNIGSQPLWGPVGYDHVDNYYLPDIESYYDVPRRQFIYMDGGRWIYSSSLPSRYRGYDLYSGYKVVINSRNPYHNFNHHRISYGRYRNNRSQQMIRHSHDSRYYVVKGHPYYGRGDRRVFRDNDRGHNNWKENKRYDRGNDHRYEKRDNGHGNRYEGGRSGRGGDNKHDRGGDRGNRRGRD
ncbi:hypothetical protein [Pedobacter gandavensis]|uniref:hypothetical protein n=1 Tax=Pedobacter gandavensis TaxID=2679963 RepID=UPI00292CD7F4|nr:hypothetical protein [Pedobacter gandavensis]